MPQVIVDPVLNQRLSGNTSQHTQGRMPNTRRAGGAMTSPASVGLTDHFGVMGTERMDGEIGLEHGTRPVR